MQSMERGGIDKRKADEKSGALKATLSLGCTEAELSFYWSYVTESGRQSLRNAANGVKTLTVKVGPTSGTETGLWNPAGVMPIDVNKINARVFTPQMPYF